VLAGKEQPRDAAEQKELAALCQNYKRRYAVAARFYAAAFTANAALASDLESDARYDAARAAVLAGTGPGNDADTLDATSRAALRRQALTWLSDDLAAWSKRLAVSSNEDRGRAGCRLRRWLAECDLCAVRDKQRLKHLPLEERKQWQALWARVEALVAKDTLGCGWEHATRREWRKAASCYAQTRELALPADEGHFWFEYAAVLLLAGDSTGYRQVCKDMIQRCSQTKLVRGFHVARACTLAADNPNDTERASCLANEELSFNKREFWSMTEQAAIHYRAGRYAQALPLLYQSLWTEAKTGRAVINWLWLALTWQKLGKSEEARQWRDRAARWLDQCTVMPQAEHLGLHMHNWLEAHILRREIDLLLEGTSTPARESSPALKPSLE
jgi:tetratricopeptide (TPR) repeat protein